jgi:hypothetical protein
MPHVIRLRGAWVVSADGDRTRHARNFGRPRTLDTGEHVWLVCDHVPGPADIFLNGEPVGRVEAPGPFAADVTARLSLRNVVAFVLTSPEPLGSVVLEIRTSAGS